MATRSASRHRTIPINVKVVRPARAARPAPSVTTPTTPPLKIAKAPVDAAWSDAHRRRIMWISVGIGSLAVILGWVSLFSAQIQGNSPTFFGDVSRLVRNVKWPWEKDPLPPNEQEIRQLEEQVFPQFQN